MHMQTYTDTHTTWWNNRSKRKWKVILVTGKVSLGQIARPWNASSGSELPQAEEPGLFTKPGVVSERGWFRPRIRHLALRALGAAGGQL